MGFDVGFIDNIEPVFVAQVIPATVIRIMGISDAVDVEALHQLDVLNHPRYGNGSSGVWIVFVAIHPKKLDGAPVDLVHTARRFNLSEARFHGYEFRKSTVHLYGNNQTVEIRCFGCPLKGIFEVYRDPCLVPIVTGCICRTRNQGFRYTFTIGIIDGHIKAYRCIARCGVVYCESNIQAGIRVLGIEL